MYKVTITDVAKFEYREIMEYLSEFYPSTPGKFAAKLRTCYAALELQPYMGAVFFANPDYRRMIVGDYVVFYKVFEEPEKRVEVHRLLHGARSIRL
ncbi:MAG: type II toxin-antitoxin system RelE/ParE family toxin [Oscillospiraceae bacterium]|nr:type II toxin-antitoxin system RelE/ParE family toxin [Oscillospiraceae bacterium]